MKRLALLAIITLSLSGQAQTPLRTSTIEPGFTLTGDDRPVIGESLSVRSGGELSQYTFKWTRGDEFGTFDDTALSLTKDYVITESDYEHWLRITVFDNAGDTVFTKNTWIST